MEGIPKKQETIVLPENIIHHIENLGFKNIKELKGDVLDIGAGDGEFDKYLSENKNLKVTSIDRDTREDTSVEVIEGDARHLSFKDESYDIVISHASIPNVFIGLYSFENPETSKNEIKMAIKESFSEMLRVLKQGGEARLAPVIITENYESQKIIKEAILNELEILKNSGHTITNEFIRSEVNPDNQKKTDYFRIIINKKIEDRNTQVLP